MSDDFDDVLMRLREVFRDELAGHAAALADELAAARQGGRPAVEALLKRVHRLAGTGATFGEQALSTVADGLELGLQAHLRVSGGPLPAALAAEGERLCTALAEALALGHDGGVRPEVK